MIFLYFGPIFGLKHLHFETLLAPFFNKLCPLGPSGASGVYFGASGIDFGASGIDFGASGGDF